MLKRLLFFYHHHRNLQKAININLNAKQHGQITVSLEAPKPFVGISYASL